MLLSKCKKRWASVFQVETHMERTKIPLNVFI